MSPVLGFSSKVYLSNSPTPRIFPFILDCGVARFFIDVGLLEEAGI